MFATKGFMLALHVPSSFAKYKNELTRVLYRVGGKSNIDIRKEWSFLDDLRNIGAEASSPYSSVSSYQKEREGFTFEFLSTIWPGRLHRLLLPLSQAVVPLQ
jgi:hypothetical protein